jgi:two-component system LytT family sensor kinase
MMNLLIKLINNLGYVILIAFIISNLKVFKKILQMDEFKRSDLIILTLTFANLE